MALTHSLADATELIGAPSCRWVTDQIRSGRFPARKIGRAWRMTDQDVADALEACGNSLRPQPDVVQPLTGLTPTSRRRAGE